MNGFLLAFSYPSDLAEQILFLLIIPTIAAALFAVIVLMVNLFARKWLTAGQMGLLWGLVLLRLAMPLGLGPESYFSLQNLFFSLVQESAPVNVPVDASVEPWQPIGYNSKGEALQNFSNTFSIKLPPAVEPEISFTDTLLQYLTFIFELFLQLLPPIWFAGAVLILGRMLVIHRRFTRKVNRVSASTDNRLLRLWKACCQQVHVRQQIPIIVFNEISQPSVMGAMRPKLLLPTDVTNLKDDQLRLIMLHELAHITRRDLGVNWILFGLRLFHWWNPIYWLAATRFHSLREQSRDAMVLRWLERQADHSNNRDYCQIYSELLLTLAQRPDTGSRWRVTLPVSLLGFLTSPLRKRSLVNRLKALRSATVRVHSLQKAAVITGMIICAATGLADVKDPPVQEEIRDQWPSGMAYEVHTATPNSSLEPLYVQVYEVTEVLEIIAKEEQLSEEVARKVLLGLVKYQLDVQNHAYQHVAEPQIQAVANFCEDNELMVCAPESLHEEIGILFKSWTKSGIGQIVLESIELTTSVDIAAQAGIEWTTIEGYTAAEPNPKLKHLAESEDMPVIQASAVVQEYFPVRVATLTDKQKIQLIQVAQSNAQGHNAFGPKVTLFNGQKVLLNNLVYRPFVIGVHKNEAGLLKPKIKVIADGMSISFRPVLTTDQSAVHVDGFIQQSEISDIKTLSTHISEKEVTIQVPRVEQKRIRVSANLKNKQSLLISIPPTLKTKHYQYLLFKIKTLHDSDSHSGPVSANLPVKSSE